MSGASAQREREAEARLGFAKQMGSQHGEAEPTNKEGEPCDMCEFCITIKEGNLIDVIEIDAASNRGIDEIRDLKEKINFAPTRAKTKTYIIDEVHMLTKEAFNALLKTLEEPPENVYFILCTTEIHKIPETIISRCQRFDFKRIDVKTIMTRLNYIAQMEGIPVEDSAIDLIARHVEGGMRDAIGLFEQMVIDNTLQADHVRAHLGITGHSTITSLLELLEKKEMVKAINLINEVHNEGYDLTAFVREILECLRDRLITGIQQGQADTNVWLDMINFFEEARDMLRNTVIPQLPIEIAVIKICSGGNRIQATSAEPPQSGARQDTTTEPPQSGARRGATGYRDEKVQMPVEEKTANEGEFTKAEEKTASVLKQEYEMEKFKGGDITEHWPRVLEHIEPPSLRRSLASAKVYETEDSTLTLHFGARFHMEKVNLVENRVKVEKAINHIFGKSRRVICELGFEDTNTRSSGSVSKNETAKKSPDSLLEKAMEIFGSEN